jgi:hypothetical protein
VHKSIHFVRTQTQKFFSIPWSLMSDDHARMHPLACYHEFTTRPKLATVSKKLTGLSIAYSMYNHQSLHAGPPCRRRARSSAAPALAAGAAGRRRLLVLAEDAAEAARRDARGRRVQRRLHVPGPVPAVAAGSAPPLLPRGRRRPLLRPGRLGELA